MDGDKIKPTITKVQKIWTKAPETAISVRGLDGRLDSLQSLLAAGGAKTASAEIGLIGELLHGRRQVDPSEFERLLRSAIETPLPAKKPKANKREPLSASEIREWADRLTAATTNEVAFEAELSAIEAIPKLSSAEFKSIAKRYLGYEPPKGKATILKKLRTRQMQDAMEAGRQSRIARIAV
ncbi:MAG TPA: hypothetical protein VNR51_02340, partial [Hyphomicrobium sp.]|nr:hypothetical protein [Hyphomicrobium sp.]